MSKINAALPELISAYLTMDFENEIFKITQKCEIASRVFLFNQGLPKI